MRFYTLSRHQKIRSLILVTIVLLSLGFISMQPVIGQNPEYLFSVTLLVPTDPDKYASASLMTLELSRIGIEANLILVGWDVLHPRMFGSLTHADYDDGGFDIGFVGWSVSDVSPNNLFNFFHSSNIDPANRASNYYPVNNKTLDGILELTMNTTDFEDRKNYIQQALEIIVWEIHPMMGIFQRGHPFYLRDNIRGFDANRSFTIEEIYFEDGNSAGHGQVNELIIADSELPDDAWDFNPYYSTMWCEKYVLSSVFSALLERDENFLFVPGLTTKLPYPVAVRNNYTGELSSTDSNLATVWELELRDDIYWHEGYGYRMNNATHREILRFDADDVVWYYELLLSRGFPDYLGGSYYQTIFGSEPEKAIVKVDKYHIQFHLLEPFADLFTMFNLVLPQHILDPTYDALGLGSGVRADGTSAPTIGMRAGDYTLGKRTSGDLERPATIGTGPYILYPGKNVSDRKVIFSKWNHFFKDNETEYWRPRVINRPDKFIYSWKYNQETSAFALEMGEVDIIDSYMTEEDHSTMIEKTGITAAIELGWGFQTMGYNILHGANDTLTDLNIRLAISHMLPQQDIVDYAFGGLGQINFAPFPQQSPYWPENLEPIRYNYTRAVEFMEKAGYDVSSYAITQNVPGFEFLSFYIAMGGTSIFYFYRQKKSLSRFCKKN
ncbi:MAG: ABC transporter substrate-binding protein [Candidatus Hodarchaeota archaeon]